jgi:DNA-directed RNA polymerase subunit M/transcription elongation factor TFIIS
VSAYVRAALRRLEARVAVVNCPKCGGNDVLVRWHRAQARGDFWTTCEQKRSVLDSDRPKSAEEHLHYHCRRCQYDWIGPVLQAAPTGGASTPEGA